MPICSLIEHGFLPSFSIEGKVMLCSNHIYYTGGRYTNFQTVYKRARRKPSFSLQLENENDVTQSVIDMNR